MTLILAAATSEHQIIVADRRQVRIAGRRSGEIVDSEYKIVRYVNFAQGYQCGIAFTGLAQADSFLTLDWLMGVLPKTLRSGLDIWCGVDELARVCTRELARVMGRVRPEHRKLTLVVCGGHGARADVNNLIPFLALISNHADQHGCQTDRVTPEFKAITRSVLRPRACEHVCRGDLVSAGRHKGVLRSVFRRMRSDDSPGSKVRVAANFIRRVALDSTSVGQHVLGLAIKRTESPEAFDISPATGKRTVTMPHTIMDNGVCVTNIELELL